ncbi:type II secretion system protein GspN [Desulfobulbus sp.]|uniref:type II secretion system protein GspN n=1 Tax=Desulfobulbus sp. TaxID=895 RepID=UPI00286EE489|nr:type II secretion system protein GspN [Desulfobulbus sp.]
MATILGYAFYGTGILVLGLWLLFPAETVRRTLEERLGRAWPDLHWRVEGVALKLPFNLTVRAINGYGGQETEAPLVRVERLMVQPDLPASVSSRALQAGYRLEVGKGSVAGVARWQGERDGGRIEGTIREIGLAAVPLINRWLGRTLQGAMSGTFAVELRPASSPEPVLEAQIELADGRVGLQRPILGHRELPFTKATARVRGQGLRYELDRGAIASPLFDGRFAGKVALRPDPGQGQIEVQGVVDPKDKFFKGLDNTVNLQAFRLQLKDKPLSFSITGDLTGPAIHYGEYAMLMQTLEQELR